MVEASSVAPCFTPPVTFFTTTCAKSAKPMKGRNMSGRIGRNNVTAELVQEVAATRAARVFSARLRRGRSRRTPSRRSCSGRLARAPRRWVPERTGHHRELREPRGRLIRSSPPRDPFFQLRGEGVAHGDGGQVAAAARHDEDQEIGRADVREGAEL